MTETPEMLRQKLYRKYRRYRQFAPVLGGTGWRFGWYRVAFWVVQGGTPFRNVRYINELQGVFFFIYSYLHCNE